MHRNAIGLFFSILTSILTTTVDAKAISLVVTAEHMPPYQIIDKEHIDGYSVEIIQQVLHKANIDYSFIPMNWDRAYGFVQKKENTVLLSVARTPDRESLFHWLFKINSALKTSIWTTKNHNNEINSLSEITTEMIAEVRNSFNHTMLSNYPNITPKNLILTTDKKQTIALVAKQRADFMLVNEDVLNWRLKSLKFSKSNFKKVVELETSSNDLYIAANKNTSPLLINKMITAYQKMLTDGSIATIRKKWFGEKSNNK